jgi:3-phenylpropionate/cinnamic acid dioxygenase small subunit
VELRLGSEDIGGSITVGSYEDREAIKDLYSRYAFATDNDRFDEWANTFTPDGWMSSPSHPSGRVTGREDLRAMVSGNSAWLRDQGIVKQRHINANFRISVEGDEAWGTCNILYYWLRPTGVTELVGIGGYRDLLRKIDGAWYFVSRDGYFDRDAPQMPGVEYATE